MRIITFTISSLLCLLTFAQSPSVSNDSVLLTDYSAYFELPRETLFTHLNKTTYVVGENIWFNTYAFNQNSDSVSKTTTNINVGIYDANGKLIQNDLWFAKNGTARGNILLDSTFSAGTYFIKSSTNWMKNFNESDAFVQKISIIGKGMSTDSEVGVANDYDIQFLPEGGHIVSGVPNVIGIKAIDANGKGIKLSGSIYDETNTEITTFNTNVFGIGKFLLTPTSVKNYTARAITPQGATINQSISGIKNEGIAMQINVLVAKNIAVTFHTNENTHTQMADKTYKLAFHKNGKLRYMSFSFGAETSKSLLIPKNDLFDGINTITLFDDNNRPISERLVYNSSAKISTAEYVINKIKTENDSLVFSVFQNKANKSNPLTSLSQLSISVLPETTLSYNPDHNMLTANLLKPYVKGYIQSPMYYFKDNDNKTRFDLDMLLITQGWSRYSWDNIFNNPPKPIYNFEKGISVRGEIVSPKNIKSLKVQQSELMGADWIDVDVKADNTFELENFYPLKYEVIRIAYQNKRGNFKKPSLSAGFLLNSFNDAISDENLNYLPKQSNTLLYNSSLSLSENGNDFFNNDVVKLDEVLLAGDAKKEDIKPKDIIVPKFTFKDNYKPITETEIRSFPTVFSILEYNGYNIIRSLQNNISIRNQSPSSIRSVGEPVIFLDGARISDFNIFDNMRSSEIEGYEIDKTGLGMGISGAEGVIRFYSRRTQLFKRDPMENDFAFSMKANIGFTASKDYYSPRYKGFDTELFRSYGTIGWLPNIAFGTNSSQVFKLPDTKSESITFYIEGYDAEENLVSQQIVLDIEPMD